MTEPLAPLAREDRIDRLVAEVADRLARDEDPRRDEVLAANPDVREELMRCFRMMDAGWRSAPALPAALPSGVRLGEFRVGREIGRGGMAVVYRAEQETLRRPVALKVLRGHLTLDPRHVDRFRREAEAAARLQHPNVVRIHAVGEQDGHYFIAMELIEGQTLAAVIRKLASLTRRPSAEDLARESGDRSLESCSSYVEAAVHLLLPVIAAVQAAHDAHIVHRDLKPSNVLLDAQGRPHVADFGLAKGEGDVGLSLTGEPIGTPYYMSPEQARAASRNVDGRTDVYSLGVVLFELLTLRLPFEGGSVQEVITRILATEPPRPRSIAGDVPAPLEAVVLRAMAKRPDDRYESPGALAADLERALSGKPVVAPRPAAGLGTALWQILASPYRGAEYRSAITLFGWPLVHVASGFDPVTGRIRVARGIFAIGNVAVGAVALGGVAFGLVSFGGIGIGVLLGMGGLGVGGVAIGGGAVGVVALGGGAAGWYASGGAAMGAHVLDARTRDPEAWRFFETWIPWWVERFGSARAG
ncbi:MAG: serine/threonine protein kinase [Planctomycetes bacterium]|nr:serine/threonine protein kinase [Planctomycetota bacterium]